MMMVGRGQRGFAAEADDDSRTINAKFRGQGNACLKTVEQPPVGKREHLAHGDVAGIGQLETFKLTIVDDDFAVENH